MILTLLMVPLRAFAASIRVTWAKIFGYRVLADFELQEKREVMCVQCPRYLHETHQCGACLCFVDAKTALNTEKCPLDKWSRVWIKKSLAKRD